MNATNEMNCELCYFVAEGFLRRLECRKNPPIVNPKESNNEGVFPVVNKFTVCGKFKKYESISTNK